MKIKSSVALFVPAAAFLLASVPAFAHHGFAGRYDEVHPVTVQGTVLEFQFVNPHSALIFEVKDKSGNVQRWHAELGGSNALHRADNWDRDTLKPGDKVTITGPQNKNGSYDMNLSHESRIILTDTGKEIHNSFRSAQPGQ
jgi:DNA/RNA endonuclease YhcR with UshA esterase domain